MRIARLHLTRYGKFTDAGLDFGAADPDAPDFHVIHGPNEAGKSTILNAWLDFLYGIEVQSRYDFIHPKPTMRIDAAVEIAGRRHRLARIKGRHATLRGPEDAPVDEGLIAGALGGLDRAAYSAMFSLDDDTIEQGGEEILRSRGELGAALFAASAGIASLAARLDPLRDEAEAFHRPRAQKSDLARLKDDLAALKERRTALDVSASEHATRRAARDAAVEAHRAVLEERTEAVAALDDLRRRLAGLGPRDRLERLRAERARLPDLPEPPAGWADAVAGALARELSLATRQREGEAALDRLDTSIAAIEVDRAILGAGPRIDRLAMGDEETPAPEARFATAMQDLPNRLAECAALDRRIAEAVRRLEAPDTGDPAALALSPARVAELRDLLDRESLLSAEHASAAREAADAAAAHDGARHAAAALLATDPPPADALHLLETARAGAVGSGHGERLRLARAAQARLTARLDAQLAALGWSGPAAALRDLAVPAAAQLADWREERAAARRRREEARLLLGERRADLAAAEARLETIAAEAGSISDEAAAATRAARDSAWRAHLAAMDPASATEFAEALAEDDRIGAARLARATDLSALRERMAAVALARVGLQQAEAEAEAAETALGGVETGIGRAIAALDPDGGRPLAPDAGLPALEDWLAARRTALATLEEAEEARRALEAAVAEETALTGRLAAALQALGTDPGERGLDALSALAEARLAEAGETARARAAALAEIDRLERAAADRARRLAQAEAARAALLQDLARALEGSWLGASQDPPDPRRLRRLLDEAAALSTLVAQREALAQRIAAMERDRDRYLATLGAVAAELGETVTPEAALALADRLRDRLATARAAAARLAERGRERAEAAERLDRLAAERAEHIAEKAAMTRFFGASTLEEVQACLAQVARRAALDARIGEEEGALAEALGLDPAAAVAALDGADRAALESECRRLEAEVGGLDAAFADAVSRRTRAEDALAAIGSDDAVARIEEAMRLARLEIEAGAREHLAARLGLIAAGRALALYRERHRSAMLDDASRAFAMITGGAYDGLAVQPAEREERLIARIAGGGSRAAADLSKGTRFQLYLALRLAGHRAFAATRAPLPFLADDILETFDEARAEAALRLLVEMARTGQVICLTHHRHLADMARALHPGTRLHRLGGAEEAGA